MVTCYFCQLLPFKYNTCYCSTTTRRCRQQPNILFKYNTCYCSTTESHIRLLQHRIQIQHLLLFNFVLQESLQNRGAFKYNTCYCSTIFALRKMGENTIQIQHLLLFNRPERRKSPVLSNSNTTLVTVQRLPGADSKGHCNNSNTTLVTVQPT